MKFKLQAAIQNWGKLMNGSPAEKIKIKLFISRCPTGRTRSAIPGQFFGGVEIGLNQ